MGTKIASDAFRNITSKLTQDVKYVKSYLNDFLIITNKSFNDQLF
jgi:hypothetical protein